MPCRHPAGQQGLRKRHGHWKSSLSPSQLCFCFCHLAWLAQHCLLHTGAGSALGPQHHKAAQLEQSS